MKLQKAVRFAQSFTFSQRRALNFQIRNLSLLPFFCIYKYQERCYACTTFRASKSLYYPFIYKMWILSGYYYPSAIPAKFGWGRVRVKHSNILIVICVYRKHINASMENATCIFFALFFPYSAKLTKASIIFFWNWMLYIGSLSTKFSRLEGEIKQVIFYISQHIFILVYIKVL